MSGLRLPTGTRGAGLRGADSRPGMRRIAQMTRAEDHPGEDPVDVDEGGKMTKNRDRMEQHYVEAVRVLQADVKQTQNDLLQTGEMLVRNMAERIAWKKQENDIRRIEAASKGGRPPEPLSCIEEMEALIRLSAMLQNPKLDQSDDHAKSMRGLLDMLAKARKDYGEDEQNINKGEKDKETPDSMDKEKKGGDEIRQTPTPEERAVTPPAGRHLGTCHGKVRRGSG